MSAALAIVAIISFIALAVLGVMALVFGTLFGLLISWHNRGLRNTRVTGWVLTGIGVMGMLLTTLVLLHGAMQNLN